MSDETTPNHTSGEQSGGKAVRASGEVVDAIVAFTQAAGGPAAAAYVAGQAIKTTGEIIAAKIAANVDLTKIYTDAGHPDGPGAHEK